MRPGNNSAVAGPLLFAGCVSQCASNSCDLTRRLPVASSVRGAPDHRCRRSFHPGNRLRVLGPGVPEGPCRCVTSWHAGILAGSEVWPRGIPAACWLARNSSTQ